MIFLLPDRGHASDLTLLSDYSGNDDRDRLVSSNYEHDQITGTDPINNKYPSFTDSYVIKIKYQIKKDFFFLVGRKIKYTVDPDLYAPPGSHEFDPGLTLNRPPSLGQVGFSLRY